MKIVEPFAAVPVPGRKPDAAAPAAVPPEQSFQATLAGQAQPAAPPPPGPKPAVPVANGARAALLAQAARSAAPTSEPPNGMAAQILRASKQATAAGGANYQTLVAQARLESGMNAGARSRVSSAAGPFQFLERTWLDMVRRHGAALGIGDVAQAVTLQGGVPTVRDPAMRKRILELRHDVNLSAGMAARYLGEVREVLGKRLGRGASETEARIAYIMGPGGAARLIRAAEKTPQMTARDLLPTAARANHTLFHDRSGRALTATETLGRLTRRLETDHKEMFAMIPPLDGAGAPVLTAQAGAASGAATGDGMANGGTANGGMPNGMADGGPARTEVAHGSTGGATGGEAGSGGGGASAAPAPAPVHAAASVYHEFDDDLDPLDAVVGGLAVPPNVT